MKRHLKEQVERIIDEGAGRTRSVIVQMETDGSYTKALLRTASQAIRRRGMTVTARDVLPPQAHVFQDSVSRRASRNRSRRELRQADQSLAAQFALQALKTVAKPLLREVGLGFLAPLMESATVQEALGRASEKLEKVAPTRSKIPQFWSSASAVLELEKDALSQLPAEVPKIADIYPNRTLSVPPVYEVKDLPKNVEDNKTSAWGVEAVGALAAWGAYGSKGKGATIGLLDTGVDPEHPELQGKIKAWGEFDGDGNVVSNSTEDAHDSGKHGTHCAGTLVGGNANGQWIGVAPEAKLAAGLVLKNGRGTDAQILAGMQWAIEQGVDVISMSLGGLRFGPDVMDTYTRTIISANQLGIPVVIAIGNEGSQTSGAPGNDYFALAVGATDPRDQPAGFSGGRTQVIHGSRYIDSRYLPLVYSKPDLTAPGVAIKSSVPGGKYAVWNGTSMATPHVAGAIALLLSATSIRDRIPSDNLAYLIQDLLIGSVEELGGAGPPVRLWPDRCVEGHWVCHRTGLLRRADRPRLGSDTCR